MVNIGEYFSNPIVWITDLRKDTVPSGGVLQGEGLGWTGRPDPDQGGGSVHPNPGLDFYGSGAAM